METKKYNKLALAGFIVGPVFTVLMMIANYILRYFSFGFILVYPFMVLILVSLILAVVSLFTRKEDQKGKGLVIITFIFPIVYLFIFSEPSGGFPL